MLDDELIIYRGVSVGFLRVWTCNELKKL